MTSFRPLRIDIDRPMLIVRQHIEDAEVRPVKDCGTGMESNEEEVSQLHIVNDLFFFFLTKVFFIIVGRAHQNRN